MTEVNILRAEVKMLEAIVKILETSLYKYALKDWTGFFPKKGDFAYPALERVRKIREKKKWTP